MYVRYCAVIVAMGISLISICCLRIRSSRRSSGPSYCSKWKFSGDDTVFHHSMGDAAKAEFRLGPSGACVRGNLYAPRRVVYGTNKGSGTRVIGLRGYCFAVWLACGFSALGGAPPAGLSLGVSFLPHARL